MEAVIILTYSVFKVADLFQLRHAQARNVVLFGECGVGKSSIINTVAGKSVAETSNDVLGCTGENKSHSVTLDTGVKVNLWDTIGLNEGTLGRIPAEQAKKRLKLFLEKQITSSEGIDLLLYCIRGASGTKSLPIKQGYREVYKFVFEDICKKRVPIALIATNLEAYDPHGDMDTWWDYNEAKLSEFGFQFCAHACVTILPAESWDIHLDSSRIETSKRRLQELLSRDYFPPRNVLLLGDRIDRADFIDMTISSASNNTKVQKPECIPPLGFTSNPVAFDMHTHVNLWNMNGFDETDDDILITSKALRLITQGLKRTGGIDLLLFCFRAGRLKIRHARNYNLFYTAICRKKVLVAMAVLGPEEGADTWWERNEPDMRRRGFRFDRHLCIPCGPSPHGDDLGPVARDQLVHLIHEEHTLGSWKLGDDAFWVTVPNVRAVIGEISWPSTTVVVCDTTGLDTMAGHGVFDEIERGVQALLAQGRTVSVQREHRFQQMDPQTLAFIVGQSPCSSKGVIGLILFFIRADSGSGLDNKTWQTLERVYATYKGAITPFIIVVDGVPAQRHAEAIWKADATRHITRRIGACVTYYPGYDAGDEARGAAQQRIADMIQDRCLVDLGGKVGILQEILSIWRRYRSQRNRASDGS